MFPALSAPSSQADIEPSFGGLLVGTVSFASNPGASLVQSVFFNLTDDAIALEDVELVTVSLNITGVPRTRIGDPGVTVINILDDDGTILGTIIILDCISIGGSKIQLIVDLGGEENIHIRGRANVDLCIFFLVPENSYSSGGIIFQPSYYPGTLYVLCMQYLSYQLLPFSL